MKAPRIVNVIGHIDDDLITAAECRKKTSRNTRLKWSSIAACFALLVIIGATFLTALFNDNVTPTDSRYKSYAITYENSAIVWSWEYKTIYEKYTSLTLDGIEYGSRGRVVSEEFVGESVGRHTVIGYDNITSEYHTSIFEVYQLKYADKSQYVAVRMDGSCYIFKNNKYEPPNTLGELFTLVDLPKSIELSRFSENGNSPDSKHFTLNSDDYMWDILASCEEAKFVEDDWWTAYDREYLSFTVTSEPLGVYKSAMYVTADGYLWTNAFDYGYLFYIGEDASGKIIKYAKENSTEAEYEPYQKSIAGTIIEITDEFILIDDAVLCNDPADGITYKVPLNDIRLSRYVDHSIVDVGDTVQVIYDGEVDNQSSNTICSAISITKIKIYFDDIEVNDSYSEGEIVTFTTRKIYNEPIPE